MLESTFWASVAFIFYTYFGYPLLLAALSLFRKRAVRKGNDMPKVSFIIAAHNEEKRMGEKIGNTLRQEYPADRLEIIVASDCSTDGTDAIVQSFGNRGVRLVRAPERGGKERAQKRAVDASTGEILVFSDTATLLDPDGIAKIVRNFSDPGVGCVSSSDRYLDSQGKVSGEGAYVRYEMLLRRLETEVNTLVGLSGSFFAARREVCRQWAPHLQSDFNTLLNSVKRGMRGVSDPESIGYYRNIADERREYERKVRTIVRGIAVFMESMHLLNPFRYGLFSWQLFSHKLCRWLVPPALLLAFLSNALLALRSPFFLCSFACQVTFYLLAFWGMRAKRAAGNGIVRIPLYFVLVNLSILTAWYRYLRGERMVSWTPSVR
ncbi:MAG: glycosyltransferase family 2 protein [Alphaproteobacteria bacterium]|uniref:Glycosyltransferase family 2 protein n=1 Tax=Candidatus Nitrobium versatile TaxID=2884831 RepID=A0A953J9N7_9BACT|nr:glycosyltransferase family 2 protein [Candidatus Nitrobium versatile]